MFRYYWGTLSRVGLCTEWVPAMMLLVICLIDLWTEVETATAVTTAVAITATMAMILTIAIAISTSTTTPITTKTLPPQLFQPITARAVNQQ